MVIIIGMYNTKCKLLDCLNSYIQEYEQTVKELKKELDITKLERDIYKELHMKREMNTSTQKHDDNKVVYATIFTRDNGEGADTETCVGVFTRKSLALEAIVDVCKKNNEVYPSGFTIEEFDLEKPVVSSDTVYVVLYVTEAHCEFSITVVGVRLDANTNGIYYTEEYKVDVVYPIES